MRVAADPDQLDQSFAHLMDATADHLPVAGLEAISFDDIHQGFARLKNILAVPASQWHMAQPVLRNMTEQVGAMPLPPAAIQLDPVWQEFMPSAPALQDAARHNSPYQDSAQWRTVRAIGGALQNMSRAIQTTMQRGQGNLQDFLQDARVQGFFRTVGLQASRVIAQEAASLHAKLTASARNASARHALAELARSAQATANQVTAQFVGLSSAGQASTARMQSAKRRAAAPSPQVIDVPARARGWAAHPTFRASVARMRSAGAPTPTAAAEAPRRAADRTQAAALRRASRAR